MSTFPGSRREHPNLYRTIVPFVRKWSVVPDDYESMYQQMLAEMQQPDFFARSRLLTAWGSKSIKHRTHES